MVHTRKYLTKKKALYKIEKLRNKKYIEYVENE